MHVDDVQIEIRETQVNRCAHLVDPESVELCAASTMEPFTTSIGIPLMSSVVPFALGSGGVFIKDKKHSELTLRATAQHVVSPVPETELRPGC